MSFAKELGSNLHMINDVLEHSDKTLIDNHVTNILEHIDHSDNVFDAVPLVQKVPIVPVQPTIADKSMARIASSSSIVPNVNDATIVHNQQPQIHTDVIQPSTQLVPIPKKKVSFQSEVHVVEPPQTHIVQHRLKPDVPETTPQNANASQNLTNINNIVGFKMSISTLYFVGLLIIIGAVAYFQQRRK
jgi:hypothetical protein